ncbi:MAG: beta-ketoacyl synthase [Polaromonas sp. 24-62-144]|nr:MAG: beta-ketoacyl synthase [Polaromonas sp. 35-63-240]OYZ00556.1 MAG: beta-ketoacyl synthase [Polaromonas sp. 28-63-22]OYZ83749.1 MAG: beta-ketoacyl synthase [Polaromonas sp. 24-62-144]
MRKVTIRGIGMVTPLGLNRATSFESALQARSAIGPAPDAITRLLPDALAAQVGAAFETGQTRAVAGLDRATQFALVAAQEALVDAGFEANDFQKGRTGVHVGIGMGGAHTLDALYTRFFEQLQRAAAENRDPTVIHPLAVPRMMANSGAAAVSMQHKLRGQTFTYSVACASSSVAIGEAYRALRHGYIDTAIVIGTEAMLTPGSYVAWNALRVIAKKHGSGLEASCRPFDAERNGFVLGEGAAALVLQAEGAEPTCSRAAYAELCGYGTTSDGVHITLPSADGQIRAMQAALAECGLPPESIGYLNAHGTATAAGDVVETESIKGAFGAHAYRLAISSTKAVHGHLIGAGGALEFALSVLALESGNIPPTAHLDNPDPRCDLDFVPSVARRLVPLEAVMSNSFAFGGTNVSLIARKFERSTAAGGG